MPTAPTLPWRARHTADLRFLNTAQVLIFGILAALYLSLPDRGAAATLGGLILGALLVRRLIDRSKLGLAAQLSALLVVTGVHVVIWLDGGALSTSALWMALVPFVVSTCGGPRTYLGWTGLSLLVGLGMVAGELWGLLRPPEVPAHASRLVTLVEITAGVGVLTAVHGRSVFWMRSAERAQTAANARLAAEVQARVAAEAQAREAARVAESASAASARFLATVSHEVRTPLSVILGQAAALRAEGLPLAIDGALGSVEAAGKLAVRLLNDTLDLSRAEAGGLQLIAEPVHVAGLVQEVAADLQRSPKASALQVRAEVAPGAEGWARCDGSRLRQMLYNLGVNAVKFTDQGSVTLRLRRVGPALTVEVADTGPGVAPEVAPRLFRPFHQADAGTHRQHGGAGLGLAIVRGLAEAMGGSVGLSSEIGQGSTFWFTIEAPKVEAPKVEAPKVEAAAVKAPEVEAAAVKAPGVDALAPRSVAYRGPILLVEDNPALAALGATMLRRCGAEVRVALDGAGALLLARDHQFGLVLLDLGLPDMRARALVEGLRALGQTAPIVALTGMDEDEVAAELPRSSLARVIQKPFQASQLASALDELCANPAPAAA
jgi:signal transduction histidine kinase/CheY-like chemotaxis protein